MTKSLRGFFRFCLATVLATVPCAYFLWEWAYSENPILPGLSYASFNERLAGEESPSLWTYTLWVYLVFLAMTLLVRALEMLLQRLFPSYERA